MRHLTNAKTIDEYLANVPPDMRAALEDLRQKIRKAAPEATELINYQIPMFRYKGNLVSFAAFKNHGSFLLMSTSVLSALADDDVKGYKTAPGTIQFTPDNLLPQALVGKLVKARMAEVEAKAKKY